MHVGCGVVGRVRFPYYAAKIEVEQKGMPLAQSLGLEVVWIRPTMMLGTPPPWCPLPPPALLHRRAPR